MKGDLLEFNSVRGYIKSHIVSEAGLKALEKLCPYDSWDDAAFRWKLANEMINLIRTGRFSIYSIPDISPLFDMRTGAILEGLDLLKVLAALKEMTRLKKSLAKETVLSSVVESITPFSHLSAEIEQGILPTGEVSDFKNPELKHMRMRFRTLRDSINEKLGSIISKHKKAVTEEFVTTRNNRFVIPMRHDYGGHLQGITHDYSGSRHSVYVEPLEVIPDNNALIELRSEISEAQEKILRQLTSGFINSSETIRTGMEAYGDIDLLQAVARYAIRTQSTTVRTGEEIRLINARHPVLIERLGSKCVPLDLRLGKKKGCLIITGPNAGGKTVALKTIGLILLMAKSGLPVPVDKGSVIPPKRNIMVEIDTSQDISNDLSTFTAHAAALKEIYRKAGKDDIVLLDEPGSGTDQVHGGAIAVSCIDALRKNGATAVVTSHSETVKLYGMSQPETEIAAMSFDETNLKPLFSVQYGVVGSSRAFEILKSIDFPEELINQASSIVSGRQGNTLDQMVEKILKAEEIKHEAEALLNHAKEFRKAAEKEYTLSEKERIQSALKYKRFIKQLEDRAKKPSKKELDLLKRTPEAKELEEVLTLLPDHSKRALGLSAGMKVRIIDSQVAGIISELTSETALINCGGKRMTLSLDLIEPLNDISEFKKKTSYVKSYPPVVLPIIVVGMRVEEALRVIEKAIDNAILSGQENMEIVHGSGTGKLKKAIREYLDNVPHVKGYSDASLDHGGGMRTIVRFS